MPHGEDGLNYLFDRIHKAFLSYVDPAIDLMSRIPGRNRTP